MMHVPGLFTQMRRVALWAVLALALVAVSCEEDEGTPTPGAPSPAATPAGTPATPEPAGTPAPQTAEATINVVDEAEVVVSDQAISPGVLFLAPGGTVRWLNRGDAGYDIVSEDAGFEGQLPAGGEFSHQFAEPGIYHYGVALPNEVSGVVVVPEDGQEGADEYYGERPVGAYFVDSCSGCHGQQRQGGVGPALLPGRLTGDDPFYFETIQQGREGTIMPAWGQLGLNEQEIWGLVQFLRSEPVAGATEWTIDDVRGSLQELIDEASLPASPTHDGNLENLMLVTEREGRSIAVIDGDTHRLIGKIPASYRAHGYTFDPTSDRWAYNLGRDGWLFKIDLYTLQPVRMVRVGHDARGLAISDDGRYLIAGNYIPNTAVIVDADTLEPLEVIETGGTDPDGNEVDSRVAIVSDVAPDLVGPYFLISLKEAGQVWRIDWSDPDFSIERLENVGGILHDAFLSPDNRTFYVASQEDNVMVAIDVEEMEVVERIETGSVPHPGSGAVWEAAGQDFGATTHAGEGKVTVWDLKTNQIAGEVPTGGPGLFVRTHPETPYVWADAVFGEPSNVITVFRKEPPFEVVRDIVEGEMTLHPEFTADGRFAYVSDWTGNVVRVYDAETLELVAEIDGIQTPTGIFSVARREETLGH